MAGANIRIGASSSEFQKQMKEVTTQLKLVSSECGLATEKAKLFGTAQEKLSAVQKELTAKIQAQNQMIQLYKDRITGINGEIDKQKKRQAELTDEIEEANKKYRESVKLTGENSEESKKLKDELQKLKEEYARSEKNIESSNRALVNATTKMNTTEKAMLQNKKALEDINKEIANSKLEKLAKDFDKVGEAAQDIGGKLSVVSAGIVGAGGALGKMAFDVEQDLSTLGGRLGLTAEETENLKEVAKNLYNDGFGESLEECVNDVVVLQQNIKDTSDMTDEQKGKLLEQISTVKTLFGVESEEITKTLNNMLNNGVIENIDQGLDLITKGFQTGLNSGGDLLDVLYEYSPQFKKLGLDGESALNYIKAGLDAGGYNADKMADSLKEISIRAIDGSKTTAEGFALIGLNADEMAIKFAAGGESAKDALNQTIEGLKNMTDPIQQDIAGVNLFGTMWEDSSKEAILAMTNIGNGIGDITDATEKAGEEVNNSLGVQFTAVLRETKEALLPFGQELLNLAKVALPILKDMLENVTKFLSGLSDEGRRTILAVAGIVAAIGPTLIALGSFSKGISNVINGYKDMKEFGSNAISVISDFGSKAIDGAKVVGEFALNLGRTALEFGKTAVQAGISVVQMIAHKVATVASTVATTAMSAAQTALNFVMSLNPIALIIIAIAALVAAIIVLWNKCEWFRNLLTSMFEGLKSAWRSTVEFFKSIWQGFTTALSNGIDGVKNLFNSSCNFLKSIWQGLTDSITSLWDSVVNGVKSAWNGIISPFQYVVNSIKNIWNGIKSMFKLPHFSITGEFSLIPPRIPRVSVDWYYTGGIFKTPTILNGIGIGDAFNGQGSKSEAVIPLDQMYRNIDTIISNRLSEKQGNGGITLSIENFINNTEKDIEQLCKELEFYRRKQTY